MSRLMRAKHGSDDIFSMPIGITCIFVDIYACTVIAPDDFDTWRDSAIKQTMAVVDSLEVRDSDLKRRNAEKIIKTKWLLYVHSYIKTGEIRLHNFQSLDDFLFKELKHIVKDKPHK